MAILDTKNKTVSAIGLLLIGALTLVILLSRLDRSQLSATQPHSLAHVFKAGKPARINDKVSPVTHIGFLKVHKAGGSTITDMLFRFGLRRNLTFVLSSSGKNFIDFTKPGPLAIRPIPTGHHYDILCVHSKFNLTGFSKVLPADAVYIGIVREPVSTFLSAVYYYKNVSVLERLITVIRQHGAQYLRYDKVPDIGYGLFSKTRNHMAHDFGFTETELRNGDLLNKHLRFLDKTFKLVMVNERYNESLVLLKRNLHWDIQDIVCLPVNVGKTQRNFQILERDKKLIRSFNYLDFRLHKYFAEKLEDRIAKEGSDFQEEVDYFRTVLERVAYVCSDNDTTTDSVEIGSSKWNDPFIVNCRFLQMPVKERFLQLHLRHEAKFPLNDLKNNKIVITPSPKSG